jgi:hypothetical protein
MNQLRPELGPRVSSGRHGNFHTISMARLASPLARAHIQNALRVG